MKKITVILDDESEVYFNEIMYSLPKYKDGTGTCTQNQAVNYVFRSLKMVEDSGIELAHK
jgi:hypothetical protein